MDILNPASLTQGLILALGASVFGTRTVRILGCSFPAPSPEGLVAMLFGGWRL